MNKADTFLNAILILINRTYAYRWRAILIYIQARSRLPNVHQSEIVANSILYRSEVNNESWLAQ